MAKRWTGYAACALTAGLVLGGFSTAYADPAAAETEAAVTEEAQELDRSMVGTTGFSKSEDKITIRASGDTEGKAVGTLKLNDSVYIEEVDEFGWYKIRSGKVEGYVPGYLIATGEEAEEAAKTAAYNYAEIGAEYLNIRSDATEDSEVLDTVGQEANLEVLEDLGEWVKVVTDDGIYGYVSTHYVATQTAYPTAEAIEDPEAAEEAVQQEYEAYTQERQAAPAEESYSEEPAAPVYAETAEAVYTEEAADTTYTETASADATYTASAGSSDVDALYQAYLTAQEAAMSPTDEADATAKANAAIDAYNAYLAACGSTQTVSYDTASYATQTDTASYDTASYDTTSYDTTSYDTTSYDTTSYDTTSYDTTSYDTTSYDTTQTDTTSYDTTSYDTTQTDTTSYDTASYDTTQTDTSSSSSSGSSTGSAIADYALQFVGNPYVYGGTSLTNGADCSGFTMSVMENFGVSLPHNAAAQSGCGTEVSLSDLQAGDLVFYGDGGIGHVAIYTGDGNVVHASNEQTGIKTSAYNYRTPVSAVRVTS